VIGYLRSFEKNMEQKTWWKAIVPGSTTCPSEQRAVLRARDQLLGLGSTEGGLTLSAS
jgi:hypothetical protein